MQSTKENSWAMDNGRHACSRFFFLYSFLVFITGGTFMFTTGVAFAATTAITAVNVIVAECSNGIDDDGDTLIDYPADPDCTSAVDNDESSPPAQCADGIDNDGDSLIDYPDDSGCSGVNDTDETDPSSAGTPAGGSGGGGSPRYRPPLVQEILSLVDLNSDGKVDMRDLSVLVYHYGKTGAAFARHDLNGDGTIDIKDISIFLYYWT